MTKKNWCVSRGTYNYDCFLLPTINISRTGFYDEIVISWLMFYIGIRWGWRDDDVER